MVNGIQPCYSGVAYARFGRKGCTQQWYTTLLFRGGVYPAVTEMTTRLWYTTLLFRGGVYPAQVFSSQKVLVATSHITNQPTEYSCFHDDQASPQALIPAIPSVLVFWRREWESNPRMLSHRRFSRPVLLTTQPSLRFFSESRRNARLSFVG